MRESYRRRISADILREELQMDGTPTSALSDIFEREPVDLTTFVTSRDYLKFPRLSDIQFDFVRHLEQVYRLETYIAMVEEFGPQWTPVRMVHMMVAQWGKGSKSPDSLVYNSGTGQWQRLDSFQAGAVASAYAEDGKIDVHQATTSFKEGEGQMFRVKTAKGFETDVWEGHRFLTRQRFPGGSLNPRTSPDWKRLWDMQVGDSIAVSTYVPEPTEFVEFPDNDVEIVGLLIGDGSSKSLVKRPSICGGLLATKTRARVEHLLFSLPDAGVPHFKVREDGKWDAYAKLSSSFETRKNPLRVITETYGLAGHGAYTKRVPEKMFSMNNRQIALLVSRLIDTDGWISISNTCEIGYGTVNKDLARDVQRLLLRLGVSAEVRQKNGQYNGEPHVSWMVRVRDRESVLTLARQLTLLDKEPMREAVVQWCEERSGLRSLSRHGDLVWDRIVSIEPLGWGEYWTLSVDGPASYVSDFGILDHNSGKDSMCRIGVTRAADLMLCLKNPQEYFNMGDADEIHLLNVAASADQARRAFFSPMKRLWQTTPYLSQSFRNGYTPGEQSISIQLAKGIELVSGHSMAETQEGLNVLVGIADEISAFRTEDELRRAGTVVEGREAKTAEGIVKMLRTSARTRFPETFKVAQISYPRFKGDAIQNATAVGEQNLTRHGTASQYYVSGPHATWEVRPGITQEHFRDDYDEDPEMSMAMYECRPSTAVNRFMRNDTAIAHAFARSIPDPIHVEYFWGLPEGTVESPLGPKEGVGWQVKFHFNEEVLQPMAGAAYALHGDIALTGDRAGVAMSHIRTFTEARRAVFTEAQQEAVAQTDNLLADPTLEPRPVIRNDFVFSFESDMKATHADGTLNPREIQIRWYRQLVWELIARGFYVASVTFDGFQSADMIQIFESREIESSVLSLDRNDKVYQTFKDVVYDNRLEGYFRPRIIEEVSALRVTPTRKIDHVPGGSKDESDALAGSVYGAILVGGDEGDEPENANVFQFAFTGDGAIATPANFGASAKASMGVDRSTMSTLLFE